MGVQDCMENYVIEAKAVTPAMRLIVTGFRGAIRQKKKTQNRLHMVARRSEGTVQSAPHRSSLAAPWLPRYGRCVWFTTFWPRALLAQFQGMRFGLLTRRIKDWTVNQGGP